MTQSDGENGVDRAALAIAAALQHASPGELAAMRRMRDDTGAPLFWRLTARHAEIDRRPQAWIAIARMLALLTPTGQPEDRPGLHDPRRPLGAVLCDGGDRAWSGSQPMLSEQRLARLLAARGKARGVALERALRILANRRSPGPLVNVPDIAWAVLNPKGGHIAKDYYGRLDHAAADRSEETT
ncbi:hypothetical protein N9X71_07890 [Paracoccus sp. (in: a-proteobacteria)]|nr:hypothetical protein [Paracoccus sp. (in: a-proteobacteria)]